MNKYSPYPPESFTHRKKKNYRIRMFSLFKDTWKWDTPYKRKLNVFTGNTKKVIIEKINNVSYS